MRKRIPILSFLVLTAMLLGGCTGRAYDPSDRKKLEDAGRKRLEAYLADHLPGAQVISAEAVEANREVTLKTLTNYVRGAYKEDGAVYEYYFDITNGRLFTSKNFTEFASCVKDKAVDDLELQDKAQILYSKVEVYLPDMREMETANRDVGNGQGQLPPTDQVFSFSAPYLPLEAAQDPEAYVYDKDRAELIYVSLTIAVDAAEETDLARYGFDDLYYSPGDDHMYYGYLCIHNALSVTYDRVGYGAEPTILSRETLTASGQDVPNSSYSICYELYDDAQQGEAEIHGVVYRKKDFLDIETGEIDTQEAYFDLIG